MKLYNEPSVLYNVHCTVYIYIYTYTLQCTSYSVYNKYSDIMSNAVYWCVLVLCYVTNKAGYRVSSGEMREREREKEKEREIRRATLPSESVQLWYNWRIEINKEIMKEVVYDIEREREGI